MSSQDRFVDIITKIVLEVTKFSVPRLGKVSKIKDPESKGRILVHIPSLNWLTDDVGAWCYPIDKKSIVTPAIGDYVIVQFIDGNMDYPVYTGIDQKMKNMIPKNYSDENTQVIAESRDGTTAIKITELLKEIILKTGDAASWAPCIVPNCIFSGAPHGGVVAGIVKLKGE